MSKPTFSEQNPFSVIHKSMCSQKCFVEILFFVLLCSVLYCLCVYGPVALVGTPFFIHIYL